MPWKTEVLVVANRTLESPELARALKERASRGGSTRFTLLVPATAGDRRGKQGAREALERALEALRAENLDVRGHVGDSDPVVAVLDTWSPSAYDEIVVSTLPTGSSRWLKVDLPHQVEKLAGVTVTHVVSQAPVAPAQAATVEGRLKPAGARDADLMGKVFGKI